MIIIILILIQERLRISIYISDKKISIHICKQLVETTYKLESIQAKL